jgi:hypothetical protein
VGGTVRCAAGSLEVRVPLAATATAPAAGSAAGGGPRG